MTEGTPRHFTTPAKITAAVAGVGLGAGIAFGLATRSKYNKCDADPIGCTSDQKDSIRRLGLAADAGFVVAAGAAIATVVLFTTSAKEPHLIVAPSSDGATVTAVGRF